MAQKYLPGKIGSILIIIILLVTGISILPSQSITRTTFAASTWVQSSNSDFSGGEMVHVEVVGSSAGAKLKLISNIGWVDSTQTYRPSSREGHAMAPVWGTNNIVMFGGNNGSANFKDTWVYDLADNTWTKKSPEKKPTARCYHSMASIWGTDQVILFGGHNGFNYLSDFWIYDLGDNVWTKKNIGTPLGRANFAMAPIPGTKNVILFGGDVGAMSYFNDTWKYNNSDYTWTEIIPNNKPLRRAYHAMSAIDGTGKVLLFGGNEWNNLLGDTWIYNSSAHNWTEVVSNQPAARQDHSITPIYGTKMVLLFGGISETQYHDDTWIFDFNILDWNEKTFSIKPSARYDHGMASVYGTDRVVLFGGNDSINLLDDTWIYYHTTTTVNGSFVSKPFDCGYYSTFNTINWNSFTPTGTSIRLQLRTGAHEWDLAFESFVGPDGSETSYYTSSPTEIWSGHAGNRWIQYKIFLNTIDKSKTPELNEVSISYSRWPKISQLSPVNNSNLSTQNPIFKWSYADLDNDPQNAFQVLIDDDIEFKDIEYDSSEQTSGDQQWQFPTGTSYFPLSDGTWYWKVRAKADDGVWSKYTSPWMFSIDSHAPISEITWPKDNGFYKYLDNISGNAREIYEGTGVNKVELTIQRLSDNYFWDNFKWATEETWVAAYGTSKWLYDCNQVPWASGTQYKISSRAIDFASNIEIARESIMITLDSEKPMCIINSPKDGSYLRDLKEINGSADDNNASGIEFVEISIKRSTDNYYWAGTSWDSSTHWLIASGTDVWYYDTNNINWESGVEYDICSRATDFTGNREIPGAKNSFIFDAQAPESISIIINNGDKYTNSIGTVLTLHAKDDCSGLDQMTFSTDNIAWSDWEQYLISRYFELPSGDGEKFVYFKVKDLANNTSDEVFDTIILDTTAPRNLSIIINDGALETNSTQVILNLNATDEYSGVAQMAFSNNNKTWTPWENFSKTRFYQLPMGECEKTIYFKVKDLMGNEAEPVSTNITVIPVQPQDNETVQDDGKRTDKSLTIQIITIIILIIIIIIILLIFIFIIRPKQKTTPEELPAHSVTIKPGTIQKPMVTVEPPTKTWEAQQGVQQPPQPSITIRPRPPPTPVESPPIKK